MTAATLKYEPSQRHIERAYDILRDEMTKAATVHIDDDTYQVSIDPHSKNVVAEWQANEDGSPDHGMHLCLHPRSVSGRTDGTYGLYSESHALGRIDERIDYAIIQIAHSEALTPRGLLRAESELGISAADLNFAKQRDIPTPPEHPERININPQSNTRRITEVQNTMRLFERGQQALAALFQERIAALEQAPSGRSAVELYRFEPALADSVLSPPPNVRLFGGVDYHAEMDRNTGEAYVIVGRGLTNREARAQALFEKARENGETLPFHEIDLGDTAHPITKGERSLSLADAAGLLEIISPSPRENNWLDRLIESRVQREGNEKAGRMVYELVVESSSAMLTKAAEKMLAERQGANQQQNRDRIGHQDR